MQKSDSIDLHLFFPFRQPFPARQLMTRIGGGSGGGRSNIDTYQFRLIGLQNSAWPVKTPGKDNTVNPVVT